MHRIPAFFVTIICVAGLSGFLPGSGNGSSAGGFWHYDARTIQPDSFEWTGINGLYTMAFYKIDSARHRVRAEIQVGFRKKPADTGTYQVVDRPVKENEVSILASDERTWYYSKKLNNTLVHCSIIAGHLQVSAKNVTMHIMPYAGSPCCESTLMSFALKEF